MTVRARVLVALLLALAACRGAEAPLPAQPGVDVRRYDVALRLDPATLDATGHARLTVGVAPGTHLELGLDEAMRVTAVTVDGTPVQFERNGERLTVPLGVGDSSVVEVAYRGRIAEGVQRGEAAGQTVVFAEGWPGETAGWLPAVHHPSDPAHFSLWLEVPARYDVAASGVPVGVDTVGTWRRHAFRLDADAPVYTFAFAVADSFAVVPEADGAVPIRHVVLRRADARHLIRTGVVLDTLAALLGPYPYAGYTTVQVPMAYAGMENAAAPFLRASLYDDRDGVNAVEEVNIHEVVHQWFGNDVVPADWRDLWLAEGFATYLTTVVYERLDGPEAARQRRVLMARLTARDARRMLVPERYRDPAEVLTPTVYQKGGAVLHDLRLRLGDAVFFGALRRLATAYADRPLSTTALQTVLEEEGGADLNAFFGYWVYGTRVPTLRLDWDAATRRLTWSIEGDDATLAGLPFELLVRQGDRDRYVLATDGAAVLTGSERPEVYSVGILVTPAF